MSRTFQITDRPQGRSTGRSRRTPDLAGASMARDGLNRWAMPHEMFIEQIRRFARVVLPILQAHEVTRVPAAERVTA